METKQLRILMIGAHPDDCEFCAGGIAIKYSALGHAVKFVSVTNGDTGHHILSGEKLAHIRAEETAKACEIAGIQTTQVLDIHSNQLEADIATREMIICLIREYKPDLIFTHRPNDYHPDHRRTSMLVQDSSYAIRVPNVCPSTPCLRYSPIILYNCDFFNKPVEFQGDILIDIDDVIDTKVKMIDCHKSQVYEWLPWIDDTLGLVPSNQEDRYQWIIQRFILRNVEVADKFRDKLVERYGGKRGSRVRYAEAFEISEYGKQLSDEEIPNYFPFQYLIQKN